MTIDRTILETYIDPYLRGETKEQQALERLLSLSLGRVLQKEMVSSSVIDIQDNQVKHIVDWLLAAIRNNEPWLTNVDASGRPKKLMKFGSLQQIIKEADKAMLISAQKSFRIALQEGDEELFSVFDDENYIVRLLSPKALDAETAAMQHCIGNGAYDDMLRSDDNLLLSIRDRNGKPHVTLQVSQAEVLQIQGKQNKPPLRKYMELVAAASQKHGFRLKANTVVMGYVIDSSFNVHLLDEIPEGAHFSGDQDWSYAMLKRLPENLTFDGNFKASHSDIVALPKGLKVKGNLEAYRSEVILIHPSLEVGGNLDISLTKVMRIPDGVSIGGDIIAADSSIVSLPETLNVNGSLILCNCPLAKLPDNLRVTQNLDILGTNIRRWPDCVSIGGSLDIRATPLSTLPDDLEVPGILWLEHTQLSALPNGLKVGEIADIRTVKNLRLGNDTRITKDLNLNRSSIDRLPDGLKVGGSLLIADTMISEIPEGTYVGKVIDISGTNVTEIPYSIPDDCKIDDGHKQKSAFAFRRGQGVKRLLKRAIRMVI